MLSLNRNKKLNMKTTITSIGNDSVISQLVNGRKRNSLKQRQFHSDLGMKRRDSLLSELLLCPRWGIHVLRVCGILPGAIDVDTKGDIVQCWSWGVVCSSVSISLGLSLTAVSLSVSRGPTFSNSSETSSWLETTNLFLSSLFSLLTISVFLLMNRRWFLFMKHLLQTDKILSLWNPEKRYRSSGSEISLFMFALFVTNGCMAYSAIQGQVVLVCSPVVWVTILWHNVLAEATQALLVVVLHALAVRITRLNRTVQNLHCRRNLYIGNRNLNLRSSTNQEEYQNDGNVHHFADKRPFKNVRHVHHLAKIHELLIEASYVLGNFLSVLSPLYILITFLGSIMLCFILVSNIIGPHNELPVAFGTSIAVFGFMKTVELAIVLYYCQIPHSETRKTALHIHKLYNETDSITLKSELLLFSNQLAKRNYVFSACGMFHLNMSLIYSIVSAISTYLVILVQFQFM